MPLAKTDKIVVINSGGDGTSGAGTSKITRDVANSMAELPAVIEALTGISLMDILRNLPAIKSKTAQTDLGTAENKIQEG